MGLVGFLLCIAVHLTFVTSSGSHSAAEDACKRYAEQLGTCAEQGKDLKPVTKTYPHLALVGYGNSSSIEWLCAGNLISERYVITAAHCTTNEKVPKWIKVGGYNKETDDDIREGVGHPKIVEIVEMVRHPEYVKSSFYNDVALLKLKDPLEFNQYIRPICLNTKHNLTTQTATVVGYGRTEFGGTQNSKPIELNMTLTTTEDCNEAYKEISKIRMPNGISDESMVCAVKDACSIESGDPLQQQLSSPFCMPVVIGTASFSKICGQESPAVYSRVSHFVPWIESVVWP